MLQSDCIEHHATCVWGDVIEAETPPLMRQLAVAQVLRGKQLEPTVPLGGQLLLCELSKDEAKFSSVGLLKEVA
jgi:hypothetical protein